MADVSKDVKTMRALITKLDSIVVGGDGVAAASKDQIVSWCRPGLPLLEEDLAFAEKGIAGKDGDEARRLMSQAADFSYLVNNLPDASTVYSTDNQNLWEVYRNVLTFSEVASGDLTAEQKAKIEKFRGLLNQTKTVKNIVTDEEVQVTMPGPVLQAYNDKMAAYLDAVTDYNSKRLSALNSESSMAVQDWALNGSNYKRRVKSADNDWVAAGYKNEVEQMSAYIDQVTRRDLTLLKARLQSEFEGGSLNDPTRGEFLFSTFAPADFVRSKGWTKFEFSEEHVSEYDRVENNSWAAEASYNAGLFKAGASTSGSIGTEDHTVDTSNFSMSFEIAQVPIIRPWFSPEFLRNTAWRFAADKGMRELSNGKRPPAGQLVAYPSVALFIRNLSVEFAELHKKESKYTQKIEAAANVSYGPFSFSGSYSRSVGERKFNADITSERMTVEGLQIIGFRCSLLPQAPNASKEITAWS